MLEWLRKIFLPRGGVGGFLNLFKRGKNDGKSSKR
jgi:hypothetical protein